MRRRLRTPCRCRLQDAQRRSTASTCIEPEGAFYAYPNLTGLLDRPIAGRTASTTVDLAALLLEEAKVAIVPGEAFGTPGYARISFALGDDDLGEGLQRIADLVG